MAPRIELKTPDIEKILRNSRATFQAVVEGSTDPALAAAEEVASAHRELIRSEATGEVVTRYSPKRQHRVSVSGEPPVTDLGNLIASVGTEILGPGRVGEGVTKQGFYWKFLEFGTRKMDPRPFVRLGFALAKAGMSRVFIVKQRARAKEIIERRQIGRQAAG